MPGRVALVALALQLAYGVPTNEEVSALATSLFLAGAKKEPRAGFPCSEMQPYASGKYDLADPKVAPSDSTTGGTPCNFGNYFPSSAQATANCSSYYFITESSSDFDIKKLVPCMAKPQANWQGKYGCKPDWDSTFKCPRAATQSCRSGGDPHFTSFDGDHYDHQGHGVYKLYEDPMGPLTIQTFQCPSDHYKNAGLIAGTYISYNAAIVVAYADHTIEFISNTVRVTEDASGSVNVLDESNTVLGDWVHFKGGFRDEGFTVIMKKRKGRSGYIRATIMFGPSSYMYVNFITEAGDTFPTSAWPDGFMNPIIHMAPTAVARGTGICVGPCMADDAVEGDECKNLACENVADKDILFSASTMQNLFTACGSKPSGMKPCETGLPTTEQLCEANGVSYAKAADKCGQAACEDASFLIDECVYDVCAGGGDAVVESYAAEADEKCEGDEGLIEFPPSLPSSPPVSPLPLPPPPSSPPPPPPPSPSPSPPPPDPPASPPPASPSSETFDDPHIITLSGERFFMHGVGVFEYASAGDVQSQVYMCPFAPCTEAMMAKGECLTFISAVAMKTAKHTIILRGTSLNLDGRDQASENSSVVYQSKAMTITAQGQSPASAPRINHQQLRNCHQAGETDSKWLWHNCTMQGWAVETEEFTVDVGVIGPYEEGWLKEDVSDRTFNLEVTAMKKQKKPVRGLINGDKNGYFQTAGEEFRDAHIKVPQVTAPNVAPSDMIFPEKLKAHMDRQCGAGRSMRLLDAQRVSQDALRLLRSQHGAQSSQQLPGSGHGQQALLPSPRLRLLAQQELARRVREAEATRKRAKASLKR